MKYLACAAAILIGAGTARGQEGDPGKPAAQPEAATDAAGDAEAAPDEGPRLPKIWFQIDVAPEIAQQDPFSGNSRSSDTTEVRWTFGLKETIGDFLNVDLRFGPVAVIDSDRDATAKSRIGVSLALRTETLLDNSPPVDSDRPAPRVAFSMTSYFTYGLALHYTNFFDSRNGTEHTLDLGVTPLLKFPFSRHGGGELSADIGPRRVESTLALGDYSSFRLAPRLRLPILRDIALVASGEAERRRYDDVNPAILRPRRDWRLQAFAGLDFAGLINRCLGLELLNEATIGARVIDIDSNVDAEDRSTLKFAASLRLSVPLTYPVGRLEQGRRCR